MRKHFHAGPLALPSFAKLLFAFLNIQLMGTNVRLPKIPNISPILISNLPSLQQSPSLGITPICNVELDNTHGNIVDSHFCDECMRLILPNVCHKLWSMLCLLEQVCLRTMECQVYQFEPSTSISGLFENIHWIILATVF